VNIHFVGRHIELGEALQEYCREGVVALTEKFALSPLDCAVSFIKKEHHQFEVQLFLKLKGVSIRSHGFGDDVYGCFDHALSKAREKIGRYKNYLDDHHKHRDNHTYEKIVLRDSLLAENWETTPVEQEPSVLDESLEDIPLLSISQAAARLELSEAGALVFRNFMTGRPNVVYRRRDHQIGLIDLKT